jgi:opacity protein-like surface antigen
MNSRVAGTLFVILLLSSAASAQDDRGASAAGSVSATNFESTTSWSFAGSFEYRFNRVAGLEVEATAIPELKPEIPDARILAASNSASFVTSTVSIRGATFPTGLFVNQSGRAIFFTNNVRVHVPTTTSRIDPYVVAGGGVANVRYTLEYNPPIFRVPSPIGTTILPPITQPLTYSETSLALTLGGGVGVHAVAGLWIEADLRMFRICDREDENAGRFGVGVRYRF